MASDEDYALALQWTALEPGPHRRRDLRPQPGRATGTSSARPCRRSRCRRRTSSTPTVRDTSATRRPAGSRSASPATTGGCRPRAGCPRTTGPATTSRSTGCRGCSTRRRASSSPPTRRSSARTTPTSSPTTGTRATARSGSATCSVGQDTWSVDDMTALQIDSQNPLAAVLTPYLLDIDVRRDYYRDGPGPAARLGLRPGRRQRRRGVLQRGLAQPARGHLPTTSCPRTSGPTAATAGWPR